MANPIKTMNVRASHIQGYLPLLLFATGFILLYYRVIHNLVIDWTIDDNFSHGFLIPVISAYLIWQEREKLKSIPIHPSNLGLLLLAGSLIFFIITNIGAELFTMRFSMLMVMLSAAVFLAGWTIARVLFFPIMYLAFMIPVPAIIWNKISFPLQLFATKLAVFVIKLFNITVYGEGNIIYLANMTLEVVDACSGLRSLVSMLALSAAFARISNHSLIKKWVLFFSAVPIAIFVNIVRLTITAILSVYLGEKAAEGFLHEASGILIFILGLVILYSCHLLLTQLRHSDHK